MKAKRECSALPAADAGISASHYILPSIVEKDSLSLDSQIVVHSSLIHSL